MPIAFVPIALLLAWSIALAGQASRRRGAAALLGLSIAAFAVNEAALRQYYPQYNIRIDLLVLIPLAFVAVSRIIFPHYANQPQSLSQRQAASCLTLSLINLVFWMFPVLAAFAIVKGYSALRAGVVGIDRIKAIIGLLISSGQIVAAISLWMYIFR